MDLDAYFQAAMPYFLGRDDGATLTSSTHRALYPRIVRGTQRTLVMAQHPLVMRALSSVMTDDERTEVLNAYLAMHPPSGRRVDDVAAHLASFLVETKGLSPAFHEFVDLDGVMRTVAQHDVVVDDTVPGLNPTLVVRRHQYPVVTALARADASSSTAPSSASPSSSTTSSSASASSPRAIEIPQTMAPEAHAFVRHPKTHRVVRTTLTPPRLLALARESGEALPPLAAEQQRIVDAAALELVARHVVFRARP